MSDNIHSLYNRLKFSEVFIGNTEISQLTCTLQDVCEVVFALHVKWKTLEEWARELTVGSTKEIERNYIKLVNCSIPDGMFKLNEQSNRLGPVFRSKSQAVKKTLSLIKTTKKKKETREKVWKCHIFKNDLLNFTTVISELKMCQEQNATLKDAFTQLSDQRLHNKHLKNYIEILEGQTMCKGKKITDVKVKQRKRKLKELQGKAGVALWFMKSFGISVKSLTTSDGDSDIIFDFANDTITDTKLKETTMHNQNLTDVPVTLCSQTEDEQLKIFELQHLLDRFSISNEAYHEITMTESGKELPRSYLVKQCRKQLNDITHIQPVPEGYGAQKSFKELLRREIDHLMKEENNNVEEVKVKISGDGAQMSRSANYNFLSFSLLNRGNIVKSAKACVKGQECYETIKTSFKDVISEINDMVSDPYIEVHGKNVKLIFYLGGDYKFILMVLGLKGATSEFACAWCHCPKQERHDMDKPDEYWSNLPHCRSLETLHSLKGQYSIHRDPLFAIPLENVVVDELHLLLRITDVLLRAVVLECHELELKEKNNALTSLVKCINNKIHVTFNVWVKKGSGDLDWTSLTGNNKKKVLQKLPDYFEDLLSPNTSEKVKAVWQNFSKLYDLMKSCTGSEYLIFQESAKDWIRLFLTLSNQRTGYQKERITPYMHILAYHVPQMIKMHGDITLFTGQGVEKINDDGRKVYFRRSNKADAPTDILRSENRQDALDGFSRKSRGYVKRKAEYWEEGIYSERNSRPCISKTNAVTDHGNYIENNNTSELPTSNLQEKIASTSEPHVIDKAFVLKLKVPGLKTHCRVNSLSTNGNKKKLQERLIKALKL